MAKMDERVSISEINKDYLDFYHHVSKTQDLEKRAASFRNPISYHFKDLHYVLKRMRCLSPKIQDVLDVGCCGTIYPPLFDLSRVTYTAVDISEISIERTRERYPDSLINWVVDDATQLSRIPDESQDLIIATQVLEHLPSPEAALTAWSKKLRKGGHVLIGTEASLCFHNCPSGIIKKTAAMLSLWAGSYYLTHACFPSFVRKVEEQQYRDADGVQRHAEVLHGHFHPLFFEETIRQHRLPLKTCFSRCSGVFPDGTLIKVFGASVGFLWLELKAKLPLLRYIGSQVFIDLEKVKID